MLIGLCKGIKDLVGIMLGVCSCRQEALWLSYHLSSRILQIFRVFSAKFIKAKTKKADKRVFSDHQIVREEKGQSREDERDRQ